MYLENMSRYELESYVRKLEQQLADALAENRELERRLAALTEVTRSTWLRTDERFAQDEM